MKKKKKQKSLNQQKKFYENIFMRLYSLLFINVISIVHLIHFLPIHPYCGNICMVKNMLIGPKQP